MNRPATWNKILVPTDFSDDALTAVQEARRFQDLTGAEVLLVHVTEPAFEGLRIQTGDQQGAVQAAARQKLEALAKAEFPAGAPVRVLLQSGRAADTICALARAEGAGVVFIASHGMTALKHYLLGSVAEKVVRHAPCSVLVVR